MQDRRTHDRRLDGWKEIGAFFGRDERTVKRWEASRGLPVRRVPGSRRATVYAYASELDSWLKSPDAGLSDGSATDSLVESLVEENQAPAAAPPLHRAEGAPDGPVEEPIRTMANLPVAAPPGARGSVLEAKRASGEDCAASGLAATQKVVAEQPVAASRLRPGDSSAWSPSIHRRKIATVSFLLLMVVVAAILTAVASRKQKAVGDAAISPRRSVNVEAQEFYLKGEYYLQKRTPESLNLAVDNYTQAIVRDPSYAEAYVGLADCYNLLREYTVMPASEAYPRALAAAKQAIAIDDSLSGAHSALAFVEGYWLWDPVAAEHEFNRAIELDPNSANAHHWYATFLLHLGRFQQALGEINRAQRLAPASTSVLADKGLILFYCGQPDEGSTLLKQLEEAEAAFLSPRNYLASIDLAQGNYEGYIQESLAAARLIRDPDRLSIAEAGANGLKRAGSKGMLQAMLGRQMEIYAAGRFSAYGLAATSGRLGRSQEALAYLRTSFAKREPEMAGLGVDASFHVLRGNPEYEQMLRQAGFSFQPEEAKTNSPAKSQ